MDFARARLEFQETDEYGNIANTEKNMFKQNPKIIIIYFLYQPVLVEKDSFAMHLLTVLPVIPVFLTLHIEHTRQFKDTICFTQSIIFA